MSFWEKRKAAVEAEARAEQAAVAAAEAQAQEAALAEKSDEELLAEAGLPDPDSLESAEQVQDFLKAALPQRLKTRALRRLWRLNPVLANVDGLVDYGEDFTDSATVVENLQTIYQVGKGMFDKALEAEAEAEAKAARLAEPEPEPVAEAEQAPTLDTAPEPAPNTAPAAPQFETADQEPPAPTAPRRMRFHFESTQG
ncbi:DUF3306 domain-containing protein [Tropicibacter naphthalenivorans]|uniref:DUF3306 domain-containing protein n=1 Tax=Tropicibacter naphthalenivorans TaxID=441103 RepID=A0A0P1GGM5_9RHOB|nr:DUF3306 domain-containing protein [Tropicibacter naphthalenivorans]CUH80767.1 hypothetical protein TRN7648_03155 [Tropicibacter naphthalenivorans]SMC90121.1 Protein of unknown function [Tropicibacter naphthalenivorans]